MLPREVQDGSDITKMLLPKEKNIETKNYLLGKRPTAFYDNERIFHFGDAHDEYHSLRYGVGLRDISEKILLKMFGKDVLTFLDRISTNKVRNLPKHSLVKTLILNDKAKVIDRPTVLHLDNLVLLQSNYDPKNKVLRWIQRFISKEDIILEEVSSKYFQYELIGPQSRSFLLYLFGNQIEKINPGNIISLFADNKTFFVANISETSKTKYLLFGNIEFATFILDLITDNQQIFDFHIIGEEAYEKFRIESGIPRFPFEINDLYNPFELGLNHDISMDKDFFIGSEHIRNNNHSDGQKKLVGIVINGDKISNENFQIKDDSGRIVGSITSLANSQKLNKLIGLAFIDNRVLGNGYQLFLGGESGKIDLCTHSLPFIK